MKLITLFTLSVLLLTSCAGPAVSSPQSDQDAATVSTVLPVTGTFLNLVYQDEIGCVREKYPLPRLRGNWRKLRAIHDKTDIEMWANCESFA